MFIVKHFLSTRHVRQQQTGKSVVDVSKIVICLNYSEYMYTYLGELFQQFQLCAEQKSMMEQRFAELLVASGPELRSQLVVDLKACPNLEVGETIQLVVLFQLLVSINSFSCRRNHFSSFFYSSKKFIIILISLSNQY